MSLGGYPFAETSTRWETLPHGAGIFALLHRPADPRQSYQPLFLDEADDVREALAGLSTRVLLSAAEEKGTIVYAVLYTELVTAALRQIVTGLCTELHLPTTPPFLVPALHQLSPVRWRRSRN